MYTKSMYILEADPCLSVLPSHLRLHINARQNPPLSPSTRSLQLPLISTTISLQSSFMLSLLHYAFRLIVATCTYCALPIVRRLASSEEVLGRLGGQRRKFMLTHEGNVESASVATNNDRGFFSDGSTVLR